MQVDGKTLRKSNAASDDGSKEGVHTGVIDLKHESHESLYKDQSMTKEEVHIDLSQRLARL